MRAMAASVRRSLAVVACFALVAGLLRCGSSQAAASPRYLAVSVDDLPASSKAHVDCPPSKSPAAVSGSKITIDAPCGCWPKCGAAADSTGGDHLRRHDRARLSTLLQRSPAGRSAASVAPTASPPALPPFPAEAPSATIPDQPGTSLGTLEFVVVVGFGTPARPSAVSVDTGSDISWIQCQPCSGHCYPQHDPLFDPTASATYAAVPCGHPQCAAAGSQCNGTTCLYSVQYGDGSSTSGVLSHETLTLTASRKLPGFAFGCGENNLGMVGEVDGLLGLGRGSLSLPSQSAPAFGATFSYCLPSYNNTPGYLNLGSTPVSGKVQYTAMVQKPEHPSFYFVELVAIDIGGYILPVPPSVFTSEGTLLDSGTILTYLPPEAYTALRDRFRFTMQQYKPAEPYDILDTCYDFTGQSVIAIPAVTLKFSDGGEFDLDFFGIMIFRPEQPRIGCLAFVAAPASMPFSIVGNTQQRSAEVIYNVAAGKIGFVPNSC